MAASVFNARLVQANLVSKTDFDNKLLSLDSKIAANKTKNESIENKFKKLKHLIRVILLARVILKKMAHKII